MRWIILQREITSQEAQAKKEEHEKYAEAIGKVRKETATQLAQAEEAAHERHDVVVEEVQREAAARVTRAEEAVLEATQWAEAAAASAEETSRQVEALVKQVMEANARMEAAETAIHAMRRKENLETKRDKDQDVGMQSYPPKHKTLDAQNDNDDDIYVSDVSDSKVHNADADDGEMDWEYTNYGGSSQPGKGKVTSSRCKSILATDTQSRTMEVKKNDWCTLVVCQRQVAQTCIELR